VRRRQPPNTAPGGYAFRNPRTGNVWRSRTLEKDFARLCKQAGIVYGRDIDGGVVIHTFRHTCATNLLGAHATLEEVASLLGDRVQTIEKTYCHPTPDHRARALVRSPNYARHLRD
jgi:integrase